MNPHHRGGDEIEKFLTWLRVERGRAKAAVQTVRRILAADTGQGMKIGIEEIRIAAQLV